ISHGGPVCVRADGTEVKAGIAVRAREDEGLRWCTTARPEQKAVDVGIVVSDLRGSPVHRGREVGGPEMLISTAHSPGGGQRKLAAIDEHSIADDANRDRVAGPEQARTVQVAAPSISRCALAVVEVAAEVVTWARPGRLDVDA